MARDFEDMYKFALNLESKVKCVSTNWMSWRRFGIVKVKGELFSGDSNEIKLIVVLPNVIRDITCEFNKLINSNLISLFSIISPVTGRI